ncbi:MAG: hypothetical protein AUH85_07730 [Chloroflexi bacterium 13_1_40CM_4_68_4]|nr:MAG: hypothetical protein AUH85_07730 [Chloroflexi bacterium 13_1_40CM_4_68_4]
MPTSTVNNFSASALRLSADRVRELVRGTILERIGDTPLVPLRRFGAGLRGQIWAKVEAANPGGSVKDRAALWMVLAAEETGALPDPFRAVLDATSGNTGVALAMVGAVRSHAVTLCLPDLVSLERKRIAAAFGARIVLTDPIEGTDGAIREAQRLAAAQPDRYVYVDQYSNVANVAAHERTTAPEVWAQTRGEITHFVAGVGTGGTIVGSSRFLRPKGVRIVAVQPDSALHGLDGLKHMASAIRPRIWDESAADEHATVSTDEAHGLVRRLAREEGLLAGPSSGAALAVGLRVAAREESLVVVVLPDGGERYLSTPLWE